MASEHQKLEAESSITDIEEAEMKKRTFFVDINDILNREIKQEATEFKPFSGHGVSNACLENNENGTFYDPTITKLELMVRDSVEDPTESKFSPAHFCENKNFSDLAGELAKHKDNHFNNGFTLKNEDHSECNDDSLTNNVESKTETLKHEDDIDIIYEDVKPETCEEKSNEKSENGSYTNVSHELSKDFWENGNFIGLAGELSKSKINRFKNGVMLDNEDLTECNDNSVTNNAETKTKTIKIEDDIDVIYNDVKPEICEEKSGGKSGNGWYPNVTDILIETEIGPNSSHELSKDSGTWPQQNIEENGTAVEKDNDTRNHHERTHTDFLENRSFNDIAGELAEHKVNHFNNGVLLDNEDLSGCSDDSLKNNAESKPETSKIKDDIDLIYDNVKPEICEGKSGENGSYLNINIFIGTEIGPNFSHGLSKDSETWPQQKIEEDGTAVERDNDTRNHHGITHTGEKQFQCKICLKLFNHKGHLTIHERTHTGEKPFQCKICLKSCNQKSDLTRHERIHTGEKPFQCNFCTNSFALKQTLLHHERTHTGEKLFHCKVCSKSFTEKKSLMDHERIHTGEKPFQCNICSKSFAVKIKLVHHGRIHTGENPFQCKICLKSFNQKGNLTKHERIHTGDKPFLCNFCPNSFSLKDTLVHHERTHTGEKPFQCQICSMRFTRKGYLTKHERIHTGENPFQCKICLKSFKQKGHLTRHEKIHSGDNSFLCKICLKNFTFETSLLYHEGTRTGEKPFHCKVCSDFLSKKIIVAS